MPSEQGGGPGPPGFPEDSGGEGSFGDEQTGGVGSGGGETQRAEKLRIPDCSICREYLTRNLTVITVCGHVFHKQCIDAWLSRCDSNRISGVGQGRLNYLLSESGEPTCPLCRVACSSFTLCDLVNITIDEAMVLEDLEETEDGRGVGECMQIGCKLRQRSLAEELEGRLKELEELRAQLGEERRRAQLSMDVSESLERKNEVLREDLSRVTRELGEMNQRYSDLHRRFTLVQSSSAVNGFMSERFQDEPGACVEASDIQEDETSRIYNLIGFNPFEGGDSQERRDDALQALKVVSNALIKLSDRYDQLKEKSSKWKARCHQLKDSHTSSIDECNFLKERLRSLQKTLEASESWRNPGPTDTDAPRPASSVFDPGYLEDGESFSHISKLIQDRRSSKALGGSGSHAQTNKENLASRPAAPTPAPVPASSLGVGPRPGRPGGMHTDRGSRAGRVRPAGQEARTDGSPAEDSPNPSYSSLIRSRKGHVMKRNVSRDSQSISSFFYTRRPKLKLVD